MTKKEKIYNKYGGRCGYCGEPLQDNWQKDHMDSQFTLSRLYSERDVHDIDNLMPSCKECNHYKRSLSVSNCSPEEKTWKEYMMTFHIRLGKLPKNTSVEKTKKRIRYMWTIANKYNITPDKPFSGTFYYETIEKQ